MKVSYGRDLSLSPQVPMVVVADDGFSPLGELWHDIETRGAPDLTSSVRTGLNSARHAHVARHVIGGSPASHLILTPSTESDIYRRRWSARRLDVWRDFVYSATSVAPRVGLSVATRGVIRVSHLTSGGWPRDAAVSSLEALYHLDLEGLLTEVIFSGCCIEPTTPQEYLTRVSAQAGTAAHPIQTEIVEDASPIHIIGFSVPINVYRVSSLASQPGVQWSRYAGH